jgi:hypothetical protein
MFVNKPAERRTVDEERGVELRSISAGRPDRPHLFVLTVSGITIPFEATSQTIEHPGGSQTRIWSVHCVGVPHPFYNLTGYHFVDDENRAAVFRLIDEAMRVYGFAYGIDKTPVEAVLFEPPAEGA